MHRDKCSTPHAMSGIIAFASCVLVLAPHTTCAQSPEAHKAVVKYITTHGVNTGNVDAWDEVLAPGYVRHSQATTGMEEIRGIEPMKAFLRAHFAAFPDWHEEIDVILAEDDFVAYVTTGTGTQTGPMGPLPPTGERMEIVSYIVHRFEAGKIAETWVGWDNLAALTQLGHFPPGGEAIDTGTAQEARPNASLSPEAFAREWTEAWDSQDVDRILTHYTEDAFYEDVPSVENGWDEPLRGHQMIRESVAEGFEDMSDLGFEFVSASEAGDRMVVEWIMTGTHFRDFTGSFSVRGVSIIEREGDKIAWVRDYYDAYLLLKQLGMVPSSDAE